MSEAAAQPLKRRRGRPKEKAAPRSSHITIRLRTDERATLDAAAERLGITTGSYVRQIVLDAPVPRQSRRPPVEKQALGKLVGLLGNIGSNINQIARTLNSGEEVALEVITEALAAVREMRDGALDALGREL